MQPKWLQGEAATGNFGWVSYHLNPSHLAWKKLPPLSPLRSCSLKKQQAKQRLPEAILHQIFCCWSRSPAISIDGGGRRSCDRGCNSGLDSSSSSLLLSWIPSPGQRRSMQKGDSQHASPLAIIAGGPGSANASLRPTSSSRFRTTAPSV
nr:hypothetical protein Iba_chr10fCG9070 [Ipomoea batatas]